MQPGTVMPTAAPVCPELSLLLLVAALFGAGAFGFCAGRLSLPFRLERGRERSRDESPRAGSREVGQHESGHDSSAWDAGTATLSDRNAQSSAANAPRGSRLTPESVSDEFGIVT